MKGTAQRPFLPESAGGGEGARRHPEDLTRAFSGGRQIGSAGLLLLLPAAWLLRWHAHDVAPADGVRAIVFLALYVILPGIALTRLLDLEARDALAAASMAGGLGMAHLTVTFVAARLAGSDVAWLAAPLVVIVLAAVRRRRGRSTVATAAPLSHVELAAVVFIALLAQQQRIVYSPDHIESSVPTDLLFHAANAMEVGRIVPPGDPRIAGRQLPYHFFSGILPAAASVAARVDVGEAALVVVPIVAVSWMAFALAYAGRFFGGTPAAGICAAALVLFHADPASSLGLPRDGFLSLLRHALYQSDSTLLGLAGLVTLSVLVSTWLDDSVRPTWGHACAIAAMALWISGTKSSVIPVAGAGLLMAALLVAVVRDRRAAARPFTAAFLLGIGAAAFFVWLLTREQSFARMFQMAPGASLTRSSAYASLAKGAGSFAGEAGGRLIAIAVWLMGFLGPAAILGVGYLIAELKAGSLRHAWIGLMAVVGIAIALLFSAPSFDQITFAFNGQVLLAVLGGAVAAAAACARGRRALAIPVLLVVFAPYGGQAARGALETLGTDLDAALQAPSVAAEEYVAGLRWIRANTPADSVLVTSHGALAPSILAGRRSFYSTGLFTPEAHALRRAGKTPEPFPDRLALRSRAAALDRAAIEEISAVSGGAPVLVIVDAVIVSGEPGMNALEISRLGAEADAPAGMALLYESVVMRVYGIGRPAG